MRKVLSIVLVLALVLGSTAFTFGAVPSDVSGSKYEDAVNVLMELDVISGYPDGSYKPAGIVTRGEMAKIIICALGLEPYASGNSSFKDMAGHWSDKYVAYAASLGIINGYPDGTFKADNTVSYDEAAKMLVAALGYTEEALIGTWPGNWVTKAKVLGIIKGVQSGSAGANRGDIALMTFQTLDKEMGKVNKDGVFVTHLSETGDSDTMLTRLGAELYDPGVDAYDSTLLVTVGAEFVVTGNEASIISLKNIQGALVKAYANSDNEIIAIKETISTFYTGELDMAAGTLAGADEIGDYEIKGTAIPAAGTTETFVFANGTVITAAGADEVANATAPNLVTGRDYTIACKISGNYITKIYSIAGWTVTGDGMIDDDDLDDIADGELFTVPFELDDNDDVDYDTFALYGAASLDDIEEDDVVYIYDDGTNIKRVDVGTEVIEGVVSKITSGDTKATIGGKVYKISTNAVSANFTAFGVSAGDEVELYLDYAGEIYDLEVIDGSDDMLAIVVDYEVGVPVKMSDGDSKIKLFLADGTVKTFTVDDDGLLNATVVALFDNEGDPLGTGTGPKGGTGIAGAGAGIIQVGSVVEYSLDKDGLLNSIALADATGSDGTGTVDVTSKGTYNGIYIASDATIFTTTDDSGTLNLASDDTEIIGTDDDDWGVTTLAKILGTEDVNAYYSVGATSKKIEWMVIEGGTTDEDIFAMYNDYSVVDTDAGYEVHVLVDGVATDYEADSLAKAGNPGAPGALALYKLVLATDGSVSSWAAVTHGGGGGDYSRIVETYAAANKVKNSIATLPLGDYALSSDVVVYTWSTTDAEWSKAGTSAMTNSDYAAIILYDIDGDLIYDYVLVK